MPSNRRFRLKIMTVKVFFKLVTNISSPFSLCQAKDSLFSFNSNNHIYFQFQEGLGLRIHSIHVLNATSLLQHVISFMRQFFSPKIIDRVVVHESLDDLHMSVPKRYLPKDYGGDEPAMVEFKGEFKQVLVCHVGNISQKELTSYNLGVSQSGVN